MDNVSRISLAVLYLTMLCLRVNASPVESNLSHRRFTTQDGLPQMQTETVWQDSRGYIYVGTLSGFVRYDGRTMTPFLGGGRENIVDFQEIGSQVRALGFVRQWIVRGEKACMKPIDPEGQLLLNNFNSPNLPPGYVLLEDRQEQGRGLFRLEPGGMVRVLDSPMLDKMTPDRKLYLDSLGLFIPTQEGLFRANGGRMQQIGRKSDVFSLIRQGNRLVALAADGLYTVEGDSLKLLFGHTFEAPDYGLSVCQTHHGQLIIADSHTLWRYDSRANRPMEQLATGFNLIKNLFIDRWDRLWAATYQGVYCFFQGHIVNHRLTDRNDIVRAVALSDGHLVEGTLNGSVLVDGELLDKKEGNFYVPGTAVVDGKVYMAGNADVASVGEKGLHWLGLPPENYRFVSRMGAQVIVGTRNSLLAYNPENGNLDTLSLEIDHPWCAVDDGQGQLWVSGNPGLYRLTRTEKGEALVYKMKNTQSAQVITALSSDGKGNVCFALGDSLFVVSRGKIYPLREVQPTLSGHEIRSVHLSPRGYLAVAAIDGLLVARMDGDLHARDVHWFNSGNGFTAIEPLMGPMAESEDGTLWLAGLEEVTSFRPENLLFDSQQSTFIQASVPWWRRGWALLGCVVILSLLIWWVARKSEQRRSRKRMETLEREKRQKELQLSAIRLKAIPHFHANVLSSIEYFVMNHSADEASRYLKLYSDFTNQTLLDIDRPARTLAEEVDYVRTYLELEKLRFGERLQYSIHVDSDVNPSLMLPTMLLHTYSQNAVKHGITSKDGAGKIDITVCRQPRDGAGGILVSVQDDGVGRAEAARSGGYSTKQGLAILQKQIELYNKTNRYRIVQQVADLTDGEGRPAGTRFTIWIPEDYRY